MERRLPAAEGLLKKRPPAGQIEWFSASISVEPRFQRKCSAIDSVTNFFARLIACSNEKPDAKPAVIAAEYVQPVPCVSTPRTNGAENSVNSPWWKSKSIALSP